MTQIDTWKFIDKVYVITHSKSNQKERITKNLQDTGIFQYEIIDFEQAKKKTNKPKDVDSILNLINNDLVCDETCRNIKKNHISIFLDAYKNNYDYILILEDDAEFTDNLNYEKLNNAFKYLQNNNKTWDVFFLGYQSYNIIGPNYILTPNIVIPNCPLCSHCNMYSKVGIKKILDKIIDKSDHIDKLIFKGQDINKLALFPMISYQVKTPAIFKLVENYSPMEWNELVIFSEYASILFPFIIMLILVIIIYFIFIYTN